MHQSDPELVQACQRGDQAAWNQLVDRYARLVYSIPRRYGLSHADADDVSGFVWASAFRHLDRLQDHTRLSAWLITTAHRQCWRVSRRTAGAYPNIEEHFPDVSSPSEDLIEKWEQQQLVRQGLELLGGRCKELLSALFMEPEAPGYQAIAKRLGMTVGSIGPTRARCFKKLERILIELGLEERVCSQRA